jgi:hypothetical protein
MLPARGRRIRGNVAVGAACVVLLAACSTDPATVLGPGAGPHAGSGGADPGGDDPPCAFGACACNDGLDNDGDGLVDWPFDLGCTSRGDNSEGGVPSGALENGWTVFEAAVDTRIVYVSSSRGDDAFDGSAPEPSKGGRGPKRTLANGKALLRDGRPDWLLLRRGDDWQEALSVDVSGRRSGEAIVIASYGESLDRPVVQGVVVHRDGGTLAHVAVTHLRVRPPPGLPSDQPLVDAAGVDDLLLEGNRVDERPIAFRTGARVRVRRNVVTATSPGVSPLSIIGAVDPTIEENVIHLARGDAMNLPRDGNVNITTRGNLVHFSDDATDGHGIMQRPGGLSEGNVVVNCPGIGVLMGDCDDQTAPCDTAPSAEIRGNVALEGRGLGGGLFINGNHVAAGVARIGDNILAHMERGGAISLQSEGDGVTFERNVLYDAKMGFQDGGQNLVWRSNVSFGIDLPLVLAPDLAASAPTFTAEFNRFYAPGDPGQWFAIPDPAGFAAWQAATGETGSDNDFVLADPSRTLATYNESLGGGADRDGFFLETIEQAKFRYRAAYGAASVIVYFREGFVIH